MLIGYLEDDPTQSDLVRQWLQSEGHEVLHRDTGADFIEVLKHHPVDLFILDWQLPDTQGIDVLGKIRQQMGLKAPVIFATQRDSEQDIVSALKGGADDYLKKPLSKAELLARIDSLARRAGIDQSASVVEVGDIAIDLDVESISQKGEPVKLTPKDYKLAVCLLRNVGLVKRSLGDRCTVKYANS